MFRYSSNFIKQDHRSYAPICNFVFLQLFDVVYREETLLNVIRSVTRNGWSIILTAALALILVYMFSIIGYMFFRNDFIVDVTDNDIDWGEYSPSYVLHFFHSFFTESCVTASVGQIVAYTELLSGKLLDSGIQISCFLLSVYYRYFVPSLLGLIRYMQSSQFRTHTTINCVQCFKVKHGLLHLQRCFLLFHFTRISWFYQLRPVSPLMNIPNIFVIQ